MSTLKLKTKKKLSDVYDTNTPVEEVWQSKVCYEYWNQPITRHACKLNKRRNVNAKRRGMRNVAIQNGKLAMSKSKSAYHQEDCFKNTLFAKENNVSAIKWSFLRAIQFDIHIWKKVFKYNLKLLQRLEFMKYFCILLINLIDSYQTT